ncbi:semialdehyde dehydrogenase [Candidatus Aerophobetes bacterium Ae_b3b]|nr:MAG: semialdehyde dehydrogenase [Candidatus Aerophobetes bacterium Ae_b3b]
MMTQTVALLGAGGKMGSRCRDKLMKENYRLLLCEEGDGLKKLQEKGLKATPAEEAVPVTDIVIMAVPDILMSSIAKNITPMLKSDATVVLLDAAVPYVGGIPMRDDVTYVAAHPCHVSPFKEQETPVTRKDWWGGRAVQDIIVGLIQGSEENFTKAKELCCEMWGPVDKCHRVTLEQMAILEPMVAEVLGAALASVLKEAVDIAVNDHGVPKEAAESFMLGHACIELGIVFGTTDALFSDACKVAIKLGKEWFFKPDWKKVLFEPEMIRKTINLMLHPEKLKKDDN